MSRFDWIALAFDIGEEAFLSGFFTGAHEADDHTVDPGPPRPDEGAMCECDLQAGTMKDDGPELRDLFALCDRVGGNECNVCVAAANVIPGFDEPCRDIVERA